MSVVGFHAAWAVSRLGASRAFRRALRRPADVQWQLLREHLRRNERTRFGREHQFERIESWAQFRSRVPIASWDSVAPYVARIEAGERDVLSTDPVLMLERTSGGTTQPKHVPYTKTLLAQFSAATSPWLSDLAWRFPTLLTTRQYWSVSPVARAVERTSGGLRIGLEDDAEYFGAATRFALKRLFAVDGSVAKLPTVEAWREETLKQLLAAEDLGFLSVWNPSFLTLLMEALEKDWPRLSAGVSRERRAAVERAGALFGDVLWPKLQLVSCWTDAWASQAVPALRRYFPRTPFQGKGLLATEGVVTFPLWGAAAPVAAVTSHVLEFESLDDGKVVGVEGVREGARYAPLLTTGNGFARYRLPDALLCVGHHLATPMFRFEGRLDRTSDLVGEKLSAAVVEQALRDVTTGLRVTFAMLAPESSPPRYVLFVEGEADLDTVARALDLALRRDHHYAYARDLGQLQPVEGLRVVDGAAKRLSAFVKRGVRLGDIKPAGFEVTSGWREALR